VAAQVLVAVVVEVQAVLGQGLATGQEVQLVQAAAMEVW
jgi:hypothetical protein